MLYVLPILFLFICKEVYGNIRDKRAVLRGQIRTLRLWPAVYFASGKIDIFKKIRKPKIRPEEGENVNRPIGWGIRESIQEN